MMLAACPEEEALLLLASGDSDEGTQSHVDACGACRRRLRELEREIKILQELAQTRDMLCPPVEPLPAIGKYVVIGRLGSGGQAEVYRALDPSLGREVAIKWGLKGQPLAQEGRDLCQLKHANLVPVFELGTQDDRPYLVMEYVRGCNLEQLVRDQPLSGKPSAVRAARLLLPVARALAEVHRRGLVHLDIKPQNILIDREGKPYLTDFGLARHYDDARIRETRPLGGTPGFMAPEQASGKVHCLGPRTDVFGLGAVLHRLLVGQPPFPGKERMQVLQETAAGKLDLSKLRSSGAPRPLTAICQRALAVEPEQRYASADALAKDLHRFLRRGVLQAVVVGTGAAVLAAAGLAYTFRPSPPPPEFPSGPQYLIHQVRRGEKPPLELVSALPMRGGDRFQLRCAVPTGYRVALFWFDAEGKLQEFADARTVPAGQFDELIYPPAGLNQLSGRAGTNLVLLCAGPGRPPTRAELEAMLAPEGPLPELPVEKILICLDRDQVKEYREVIRGVDVVGDDPLSIVQRRLEQLRLRLRDRWPFLAGVALQQRQ